MNSEISRALQQLGQLKTYHYFKNKGMPEFVEPLVTELINSFANSSEIQQEEVMSEVSLEVSVVLGWYARKVAGRAVREGSRTDLRNGILALVIGERQQDFRDSLPPLALLNNSALKLGEDPRALFEDASRTVHKAENLFDLFLHRPPDLNTIQTFGFNEGLGPRGFDYIPLLAEFGGPTPF